MTTRQGVSLKGALDHPLEMRYGHAELMGLTDLASTVICDRGPNVEVAGKAVTLTEVFGLALVRESATTVIFRCSDGHEVSVSLAELVLHNACLLYESPTALPRLVIPGKAGARWAKGIREIEFI